MISANIALLAFSKDTRCGCAVFQRARALRWPGLLILGSRRKNWPRTLHQEHIANGLPMGSPFPCIGRKFGGSPSILLNIEHSCTKKASVLRRPWRIFYHSWTIQASPSCPSTIILRTVSRSSTEKTTNSNLLHMLLVFGRH